MKPSDLPGQDLRFLGTPVYRKQGWDKAALALSLSVAALLALYWGSAVTLVQTWERSGTYTHGFLVVPISVWLIWRRRAELMEIRPKPFLVGLWSLGAFSALWFLGYLANVQTLQEFALVASLPLLCWTILGTDFARKFAFELAFVLFAWPFGEFLIPPLIDWTADFTVTALRFSGVPVFRQGNNFTIPTGDWSVIDACSGVRYLIASIYGGSLFAYLSYRSWKRRLTFLGVAIAVPILANWLRAYMIVLLGHFSNNRLATGVDHLIYGWVFFGLVMAGVFYIGVRWSEPEAPKRYGAAAADPVVAHAKPRFVPAVAAAAIVIALGPGVAAAITLNTPTSTEFRLSVPSAEGGWQISEKLVTNWRPPFKNPTAVVQQTYLRGDQQVELNIAYYQSQRSGAKLLTFMTTTLSDYDPDWRTSNRKLISATDKSGTNEIIERQLQSSAQHLLVWQWYWIGGAHSTDAWSAKLAEMRAKLLGLGEGAAGVTMIAAYRDDPAPARAALREFFSQMNPSIEQTLNDVAPH